MRSIRKLLHHQSYRDRHGNRQETRTWYITISGRHHPLGEDVIEAEARAKELLSRTARRREVVSTPHLEDLLQLVEDDYAANHKASLPHLKSRAVHLRAFWAENPRATTITTGSIRAYQAHRQHEGAKPGTINVELALLQRGFSLARQDGYMEVPPVFPRLTENNARKGFFERAEMEAIAGFCPEYLQGLVRAAYYTGWRKRELMTRQWRHVEGDWLRLDPGETKNGEGREFPIIDGLREVLACQRTYVDALQAEYGRVIPWVFPNDKGEPITYFWEDWDRARKWANLPHRIFHDFRRTAVRNLEQAGVPRSAAMSMVGHKTMAMYSRYAIADRGLLTSAGEKLTSFHNGSDKGQLKVRKIFSTGEK